jgi:hypothetical protein
MGDSAAASEGGDDEREMMLFIGTRSSNLYTQVHTPAWEKKKRLFRGPNTND